MSTASIMNAPPPRLRIVATNRLHPHELHDTQRLLPLIDRLRRESVMINPPIVAPMSGDDDDYVVLDGANRTSAFSELGYPHVLVQIAPYDSPFVQLETWQHVVCSWEITALLDHVQALDAVRIIDDTTRAPLASVRAVDGRHWWVDTVQAASAAHRNRALVEFVSVYQRNAVLHRTTLHDPVQVWHAFTNSIALITFPGYRPADVIAAARDHAYVPPGITRHIIHGRALRVNYPLEKLRDPHISLEEKNQELDRWYHDKIDGRHIRFYAESTYQFDE